MQKWSFRIFSVHAIEYQEKSENYMAQKLKLFLVAVFSFIGISLDDRKFSFADIGIINFHNFLFVAVQNLTWLFTKT